MEEGEISGIRIDDNSWRISKDVVSSLQEYGEILGDIPEVVSIDTVFTLR